jgi:hypothetical protein
MFETRVTDILVKSNEVEELSPKGYDDSSEQVNFGYRTFCQRYFELLDSKTYLSRLKLLPWAWAEHPQFN